MEPGDLRVNYYTKHSGFPNDQVRSENQTVEQSFNSQNHTNHTAYFHGHRSTPSTSTSSAIASLVPDRSEPVRVWRDPHLVASTEIRHVDSLQHSTFMAHHHSGSGRGQPPINPNSYQQVNVTQSVLTSGRLLVHPPNQGVILQPRGSPIYSHGMPKTSNPSMWRHRYPHPSALGVPNVSLSPVDPDIREYRVDQELMDKRIDTKLAAEQAVHQHFEESLRLAHQKRGWTESNPIHESRPSVGRPMNKHPSDKAMYYGPVPGSSPYLPQQVVHAGKKTDLPAPPPLHSEVVRNEKSSIYGQQDLSERHREALPSPRLRDSMQVEPKSMYGHLDITDRPREPLPSQIVREPERSFYTNSNTMHSKNTYSYPPAHINRVKVSSPAPPQIYGKPHIPAPSGPAIRNIYEPHIEMSPLSLTSKGSTRSSETPPSSSSSNSLPKHEVRSADLAYYMYSNNQSGPSSFHEKFSISPQPLPKIEFQTQPLDLGGKRKSGMETVNLLGFDAKKVKTEDPIERKKIVDTPISVKYDNVPYVKFDGPVALKYEHTRPTVEYYGISNSMNKESSSPKPLKIDNFSPKRYASPVLTKPSADVYNGESENLAVEVDSIKTETALKGLKSLDPVTTTPKKNFPVVAPLQTPAPAASSGSIQKVPKKAWVHQWHHGEDSTNSDESPLKHSSPSPLIRKVNNCNFSPTRQNVDPIADVSDGDKLEKGASGNSHGKGSSKDGQSSTKNIDTKVKKLGVKGTESVSNGESEEKHKSTSGTDSDTDKCLPIVKRALAKEKLLQGENAISSVESTKESDSEDSTHGKGSPATSRKSESPNNFNITGRRGRKPRETTSAKSEKKSNPFKRPPINLLKKTGESFLQDGPCSEVSPKLGKCRECRWTPNNRMKKQSNIFCRFYAFRKLRYTKNGVLAIAGFSDPYLDPTKEDTSLWLPSKDGINESLDLEMGKFLISQLGDQFCELIEQEREALEISMAQDNKTIAWKRVVHGVREMCDVCDTTLFNFHWACGKCGFVVCIACYKARKNTNDKIWSEAVKERDEFQWLFCSNRQSHDLEKLMLTQAIAGDSLVELGKILHKARSTWKIPQVCGCAEAKKYDDVIEELVTPLDSNGVFSASDQSSSEEEADDSHSTLRELLILGPKVEKEEGTIPQDEHAALKEQSKISNDSKVVEKESESKIVQPTASSNVNDELKHFVRRRGKIGHREKLLPIKVTTLSESTLKYPTLPHSWLCSGTLLRLLDPSNPDNYSLFQDMWKRGQPVIVSNVASNLNKSLWSPESFCKDFSDLKNDLVNCMTGKLVPNQPMKKFWEGFDVISKRLKDEKGSPMLLKLKDWPPGEDFAELLPSRFKDLMAALPLSEYTHRDGRLNLAARLPDNFVKPDLGPKMYIAYGSGVHLEKGTTNLHLDVSDAVNVMVHVGIPKDCDSVAEHNEAVLKAIEESDCDVVTINRITQKKELPGALWHIYNARDADKIRDLLNKVAVERGERLEYHHDAIHDQSWYLDQSLRKRLMQEYNVNGYPIVQCAGDAVFIPAGAPHQVRNLHNCIKIAEDFVSPENVSHCFH